MRKYIALIALCVFSASATTPCDLVAVESIIQSRTFNESDRVKNYLDANMQFPQMNSGIYLTAMSNFLARSGRVELAKESFTPEQVRDVSSAMDKAHAAFGIKVNFSSETAKTNRVRSLVDAFNLMADRIYKVAKLLKGEKPDNRTTDQKADWIHSFQRENPETWLKLRRVCARAVLFMKGATIRKLGIEYRTVLTKGFRENGIRAAGIPELKLKQGEVTQAIKEELASALDAEFPWDKYPQLDEASRQAILKIFIEAHG